MTSGMYIGTKLPKKKKLPEQRNLFQDFGFTPDPPYLLPHAHVGEWSVNFST